MLNKRKIYGLLTSITGIQISKLDNVLVFNNATTLIIRCIGILIACVGVAVFATGIKNRVIKTVRICQHCYFKNDAQREKCIRCKKPLQRTE